MDYPRFDRGKIRRRVRILIAMRKKIKYLEKRSECEKKYS